MQRREAQGGRVAWKEFVAIIQTPAHTNLFKFFFFFLLFRERGKEREREKHRFVLYLFMHSLVDFFF